MTTAERNQTLGQQGQVYEQFYIPELIEADYQSIYFGTPSEDELIRAAARMGLSHDSRAPLGLTDAQKEEIRNDPEIMRLRDKRGRYTEKLVRQGYRPIETGKGTSLYARYEKIDRRIKSMTTQLKRARESQAKKDFHDTIDDLEINKQLDGAELPEMPTRARAMQFEFPERARIVRLMSLNLTELEEGEALAARMKFIRTLARYCHKQESRKFRGSTDVVKLDKYDSIKRKRYPAEGPASGSMTRQKPAVEGATSLPKVGVDERGSLKRRRSTSEDGGGGAVAKRPKLNTGETAPAVKTEDHDIDDDVVEVRLPMTFDDFVCIRCLRHLKKGASREALTKPLKRKFTLQRHLQDIHINNGEFDEPFECDHPDCAEIIDGVMHYKAHCFRVHRVEH